MRREREDAPGTCARKRARARIERDKNKGVTHKQSPLHGSLFFTRKKEKKQNPQSKLRWGIKILKASCAREKETRFLVCWKGVERGVSE